MSLELAQALKQRYLDGLKDLRNKMPQKDFLDFSGDLMEIHKPFDLYKKEFEDNEVMTRLSRATIDDYNAWLKGHLENGGSVTRELGAMDFDLAFSPEGGPHVFYVATADLFLPYETNRYLQIIVPTGLDIVFESDDVKRYHSHLGYNRIFFMDGFRTLQYEGDSDDWNDDRYHVPLYGRNPLTEPTLFSQSPLAS
ncbi:MAG: hypothetical protein Q7S53_00715 [bacterium]|nr:hypothetical protein [bacterium]